MPTDEDYVRRNVERLAGHNFELKEWLPSAALFPISGSDASAKYHGQSFDPAEFRLVEDGWDHDHCPFCHITVSDRAYDGGITEGYTDGYNWVCPKCYRQHLEGEVAP
jgi:hypothetical protein